MHRILRRSPGGTRWASAYAAEWRRHRGQTGRMQTLCVQRLRSKMPGAHQPGRLHDCPERDSSKRTHCEARQWRWTMARVQTQRMPSAREDAGNRHGPSLKQQPSPRRQEPLLPTVRWNCRGVSRDDARRPTHEPSDAGVGPDSHGGNGRQSDHHLDSFLGRSHPGPRNQVHSQSVMMGKPDTVAPCRRVRV